MDNRETGGTGIESSRPLPHAPKDVAIAILPSRGVMEFKSMRHDTLTLAGKRQTTFHASEGSKKVVRYLYWMTSIEIRELFALLVSLPPLRSSASSLTDTQMHEPSLPCKIFHLTLPLSPVMV